MTGFVGTGNGCSFPAGLCVDPFDRWQASQVLQKLVTDFAI